MDDEGPVYRVNSNVVFSKDPIDEEEDLVNHPPHYNQYEGFEVINITEHQNFNRGNAIKYILRAGDKEGADLYVDLEKSIWYLDREILRIETLVNENTYAPLTYTPISESYDVEKVYRQLSYNRAMAISNILNEEYSGHSVKISELSAAILYIREELKYAHKKAEYVR